MSATGSTPEQPDAWAELLALLEPGEVLEWIVLGEWFGHTTTSLTTLGMARVTADDPGIVPHSKQHQLLDPGDAEPLMKGWILHGYNRKLGGYAVQVWTNRRILRTQLLGMSTYCATILSIPRNPEAFHCHATIPWARKPQP